MLLSCIREMYVGICYACVVDVLWMCCRHFVIRSTQCSIVWLGCTSCYMKVGVEFLFLVESNYLHVLCYVRLLPVH